MKSCTLEYAGSTFLHRRQSRITSLRFSPSRYCDDQRNICGHALCLYLYHDLCWTRHSRRHLSTSFFVSHRRQNPPPHPPPYPPPLRLYPLKPLPPPPPWWRRSTPDFPFLHQAPQLRHWDLFLLLVVVLSYPALPSSHVASTSTTTKARTETSTFIALLVCSAA